MFPIKIFKIKMPPKAQRPNWAAINNINNNRQPPRREREDAQAAIPAANPVFNNRRVQRRAVDEPRGRIRGQNGHLIQSMSWVFTLRLSVVRGSVNYVNPNGADPNDYMIPSLNQLQARFNNPFNAPRGHQPVYISYQLELGENGDPAFGGEHYHYQGYIEFDQPVTAIEIVEMMGESDQDPSGWWNWDMGDIYLAPREKSQQAAQQYTHKQDTVVTQDVGGEETIRVRVEQGQMRGQQGNAYDHMNQMINNGANFNDLVDAYPRQALMAANGLTKKIMERLKLNPPEWRDVKVFIFWGDSRTGKTRKVYDLEGIDRIYSKTDDGLYFDGYDPQKHKVLLLDESYGNYPHGKFLHWLEGHPHLLNQKFGGCWANWERVYITSNVPPRLWYNKIPVSQQKALYKRYSTGGIVKFVNTNDPISLRDHNEEIELNLNANDRQYVVMSAVDE